MIEQVQTFLASPINRTDLYTDTMHLYCRKARHYIEGQMVPTFDIANVTVNPRGQGIFTAFLDELEAMPEISCIYVENILTIRLLEFFKFKRRYSSVPIPGTLGCITASVYKRKQ